MLFLLYRLLTRSNVELTNAKATQILQERRLSIRAPSAYRNESCHPKDVGEIVAIGTHAT
jgi:hypothetical protein